MDEGGRDNRRHKVDYYNVPPWNMIPQYQIKEQNNAFHANAKFSMLREEKDAAIKERDRALAEKRAALEERDAAIKQRDAAFMERDNALRERDNAIAALQFQENSMNALLGNNSNRRLKRTNHHLHHHPTYHHPNNNNNRMQLAFNMREDFIPDTYPVSAVPYESPKSKKAKRKPKKAKKMGEDLNRHVTTDGSKAEWDAQDLGLMDQIQFDETTMPGPVCSCTGVARHCYKWGNGGWQSSCCTTTLSVYPLPQIPNKKHARMGGRKMSGSVFGRLLTRLVSAGHDLSVPLDLKNYWAKHGTNRYITIK